MINILQEIGKLHKILLTDFLKWYVKEYKLPQQQFVKLEFELQLGVLLRYLDREYFIIVYCDRVGNIIVYEDKTTKFIKRHQYKEGGIMQNYIMGIIRAFMVIKERKKI